MNYLDMLVRLGIANAHPGGFTATLEQLEALPLPQGSKILEVGCGAGRTACHLAKEGFDVTGLDIRQGMIDKARERAADQGLNVRFVQGDVQYMPFKSNSFDVIIAESVSVFTNIRNALREYFRVLHPGGILYDREMIALHHISSQLTDLISGFYGVHMLLKLEEWKQLLKEIGFQQVRVWNPSAFPENMWEDEIRYPDMYRKADQDAYQDERIWRMARKYDDIMIKNKHCFGFAVFIGDKPSL